MSLAPALFGMAFGLGLLLVIAGLRGVEQRPRRAPHRTNFLLVEQAGWRLAGALVAGIAAFLLTGWLVGGVLAALAAVSLPRLLGGRARRAAAVARTEAVATWAEMLRDTMAAAAGLEEAIVSTAPVAPPPIRPAVRRLAQRLEHDRLVPALHAFAADLDDPTADLVASALALAADKPARDLGGLLGSLARSARLQSAMALRVEAGRSRLRTSVRVVTVFTVGFALAMVLLSRAYLEPYDDALGQAVLVLVGGCFAAALWKLDRMARIPGPPRILGARLPEGAS